MRKIYDMKITILLLFLCSSVLMAKNTLDVSINLGNASGSGFGISYSIENLRLKLTSVYTHTSSNNKNVLFLGGSIAYNIKKIDKKNSALYLFFGSSSFTDVISDTFEESLIMLGPGMGVRKYFDKHVYVDYELGYSLLIIKDRDRETSYQSILGIGVSIGYSF